MRGKFVSSRASASRQCLRRVLAKINISRRRTTLHIPWAIPRGSPPFPGSQLCRDVCLRLARRPASLTLMPRRGVRGETSRDSTVNTPRACRRSLLALVYIPSDKMTDSARTLFTSEKRLLQPRPPRSYSGTVAAFCAPSAGDFNCLQLDVSLFSED